MMKINLCAFSAGLLSIASGTALAHDDGLPPVHVASAAPAIEVMAVERTMLGLFERPGAPLSVKPVAIEGDFAVAGWTQGLHGGRALLQRNKGRWSIVQCGGNDLAQADSLSRSGLTAPAAKRLAQLTQNAEAQLPAQQRNKLSNFEGIVKGGVDNSILQANARLANTSGLLCPQAFRKENA